MDFKNAEKIRYLHEHSAALADFLGELEIVQTKKAIAADLLESNALNAKETLKLEQKVRIFEIFLMIFEGF